MKSIALHATLPDGKLVKLDAKASVEWPMGRDVGIFVAEESDHAKLESGKTATFRRIATVKT